MGSLLLDSMTHHPDSRQALMLENGPVTEASFDREADVEAATTEMSSYDGGGLQLIKDLSAR